MIETLPFDMASLRAAYATGVEPQAVVREVYRRIETANDRGIFILLRPLEDVLIDAERLTEQVPSQHGLWGIPFCVKDNIDVGGLETTAACPAYAYQAETDAVAVARLRAAGALMIGKTNLDQFATGLVGVRTPYPVPKNAVDPDLVPGGSSSGSAVSVARGIVSFSLGTDTAGSGRVPAALNNIVGLKPTLGAISARGVVPACRTLDTISVFALNVSDAYEAARIMAQFDDRDAYSRDVRFPALAPVSPRPRVGIPDCAHLNAIADPLQRAMFDQAISYLKRLDATFVQVDMAPLFEVAHLLYAGSWIAERHSVIAELLTAQPDAIHPTTRAIIEVAEQFSATDSFRNQYRLAELKAQLRPILEPLDLLAVPSIPRFVRTIETDEDPIGPNSELGTYTNFANLLDLCAIAVPVSARSDGLPGGITLLARAGRDAEIAAVAEWLHGQSEVAAGATDWAVKPAKLLAASGPRDDEIELAVVGAHMSGLPLNGDIRRLGGRFLRETKTAPTYRLYALPDGPPARPGLVRCAQGQEIAVETWALPKANLGEFISSVPAPLGIGTLSLETGENVKGFICEAAGTDGAIDVTEFGGWRAYLALR